MSTAQTFSMQILFLLLMPHRKFHFSDLECVLYSFVTSAPNNADYAATLLEVASRGV